MMWGWLLVAALAGAPAPGASPPSPLQPHAVIAQGLVELTDGSYAWSHTAHEVTGPALTIETAAPTFLLARGDGAVVLTRSDGVGVLLSDGEAQLSPDRATTWTAIAMAESGGGAAAPATRLDAVAIVPAETGADAFVPGAGWHDLELHHIVLPAGASLPSPTGSPALAIVTGGSVVDSDGTESPSDGTIVLEGSKILTNASEQPATLVVATVGPAVDIEPGATATTTTTSPGTTNPPPPPPAATTTSTTTTTEAPVDTDGDGLTDDEEAELGTDPANPDSDDDELTDGDEVETYGTDPLDKDTDDDELPDAGEVITYGSDPARSGTPTTTACSTSSRSTTAPARPTPTPTTTGSTTGRRSTSTAPTRTSPTATATA